MSFSAHIVELALWASTVDAPRCGVQIMLLNPVMAMFLGGSST